jgi:hypothetical protein
MTLEKYVSELLAIPVGDLSISQIESVLRYRREQDRTQRQLIFVPDETSYEYRRGSADANARSTQHPATAELEWKPEGDKQYTDEEKWDYLAGFKAAAQANGLKKIGI